jgi:electron transfer flavoprotein beta subunit
MALNIVCCVKQVPDPETPASAFKVDEAAKKVIPAAGIAPVISQFDQIAVEAALRVKEGAGGDGKITILSLGPDSARDVIKTGLAMGADEGVHLNDAALFDGDSFATATALAAAIQKIGDVDLVITGRQATDWDFGVTGLAIAEILGVHSVHITKAISYSDGKVQAQRILGDSFETVEVPTPAVVTVSNELGEPRYPKLPQIMQAARKQVTVWTAADLGLSADQVGAAGSRLELEKLYIPQVQSNVTFIEGENAEEMAHNLAVALREAKLI